MIKAKKFLVRVGDSVQKAYDVLVDEQEKNWAKYMESSERTRNYLTSLLPKGYKADFNACFERHTDGLVDGFLILKGTIDKVD